MLGVLAQAHAALGQLPEAMIAVQTALAIGEQTGQPLLDAELHRGRGEVLLAGSAGDAANAEALFRRAIEIARAQEARSFELRAVMSLARLLRTQERVDEARALLGPVYAWFTEGFETRDLVEAKALLDELT
jgi:predicted ATPase